MLSYLSVISADREQVSSAILQYFICEAVGSGADCDRSQFDRSVYAGLQTGTFVLLGLLPSVNLVLVVSFEGVKDFGQRVFYRFCPTGWRLLVEKNKDETKERIVPRSESCH